MRQVVGGGTPLPAALRAAEETRFGASFGDVRLHDSPAAHGLAQQHLARAFTVGSDIVFNEGRYQPGSQEGRRLLAHELAHVVQQSRGAGGAPTGPAHEAAAEASARAVVSGGNGQVRAGPAAARGVQCEPLSPEEIAQLTLPLLQARIADNEGEASAAVISDEYRDRLAEENILLQSRYAELTRAPRAEAGPPAVTPETAAVMARISAELAEVEPLVTRLAVDVPANPRDHALNTVRGVAARLQLGQEFVTDLASRSGALSNTANTAAARFQVLRTTFAPVVATAERWHTDNPAGESLGMWNDKQETRLVETGLEYWDKGGWHRVSGAAAFVGATGVAVLDLVQQQLSLGFHEAATAVSQAYTRGDISWNDGDRIVGSAAWRALLTAAVTRGAGALTSRLGTGAAQGLRLAPEALSYGTVAGGVSGSLTSAVALGTHSLLTSALQEQIDGPAARAIWNQGLPRGREWAVAIPLSILLGGARGARAVQLGNERLIGSVVNTPGGPARIVAITKNGTVVLQPVGVLGTPPPPPPPSAVVTVYDPTTRSWGMPQGAGRELVTVPRPTGTATTPATPLAPTPAAPAVAGGVRPALPAPPPRPLLVPATRVPDELATSDLPTPTVTGPTASVPVASAPVASAPAASAPAPAPARPPSATRTLAARRVAETEAALATAGNEAALARAGVAAAEVDLQAARDLAAGAGGSAEGMRLVRQAEAGLRQAQAQLRPLELSEGTARAEAAAATRGRDQVVRLEVEIARLDTQISAELNPPSGFTTEQIREGRRPGLVPGADARLQPSGARYHQLVGERSVALRQLVSETEGLTRSLSEQVAAATPGRGARPTALRNAASLDPPLRPVSGVPIDVTTGLPMKTADWATDHIVSRTEIARDPRFARLTPLQRDDILLKVPENYLPLTAEANSSKGGLSVDEWIAARASSGRPLPPHVAVALRATDKLARAAIETRFNELLSR